jgi:hypothetical protein
MQAGKRKATLPLIRRFNEHSEKLLQSALYVFYHLPRTLFHLNIDPLFSGDSTGKRRRTNAATEVRFVTWLATN